MGGVHALLSGGLNLSRICLPQPFPSPPSPDVSLWVSLPLLQLLRRQGHVLADHSLHQQRALGGGQQPVEGGMGL